MGGMRGWGCWWVFETQERKNLAFSEIRTCFPHALTPHTPTNRCASDFREIPPRGALKRTADTQNRLEAGSKLLPECVSNALGIAAGGFNRWHKAEHDTVAKK